MSPDTDIVPVRSSATSTFGLRDLVDWFGQCSVASDAIETTGVHWMPAFDILAANGFEVVPMSARQAENVPGRNAALCDAGRLHANGLLRGRL